jgi:hypothetical protein
MAERGLPNPRSRLVAQPTPDQIRIAPVSMPFEDFAQLRERLKGGQVTEAEAAKFLPGKWLTGNAKPGVASCLGRSAAFSEAGPILARP